MILYSFFLQSNSTEKSWLWLVMLSNQMKNQSKLWGYTSKPNRPFLDINLMRTNKYMIYRYEVKIFLKMQTKNKVCWFACKLQMKICQYQYMLSYRVQLQILIVSIISEPWNIQILFNTYLSNPSTPQTFLTVSWTVGDQITCAWIHPSYMYTSIILFKN